MKILIADDSRTMLRIICNVVKQLGFKEDDIIMVENGLEGIKKFNDEHPQIVLTDWNMPVMNGLEFVKRIREVNKKVPIIMITTEGGKSEVITALKAGVNNYIVKPFDATVLKEKLSVLLPKENFY